MAKWHKTEFLVTVYTKDPEWKSVVMRELRSKLKELEGPQVLWFGMYSRVCNVLKISAKYK